MFGLHCIAFTHVSFKHQGGANTYRWFQMLLLFIPLLHDSEFGSLCFVYFTFPKPSVWSCLQTEDINSKQWPTVRLGFGLAIRIYDVFTTFPQCNGQLEFPKLFKSLVSLTECAWDFQDNALWDTL